MRNGILAAVVAVLVGIPGSLRGQVCNIRVVTDASPDCHDMESFLRSATGAWSTPKDRCWALFYWVHIGRRQTSPMIFHGVEVTDPIRQFNDFGYTMCSTVAGMNCALWHNMGLPVRFWDVTLHTVSECFYDGRWHMYDNSMSALYTLCDRQTIAGVEDLGAVQTCQLSGGRSEIGHVVKYHCLTATSPNGFLTGADCARDLDQESRCFRPNGLKLRTYYNNWDWGHRYILNLHKGESYTRYYYSLGDSREYFVPNRGKDPESANPRYHIRANGVWEFKPLLTPDGLARSAYIVSNVTALSSGMVCPGQSGKPGEIVFKITSANIATSQIIRAKIRMQSSDDHVTIAVSTTAGTNWRIVYDQAGPVDETIEKLLIDEVNGQYEIFIKFILQANKDPEAVGISDISIETRTMLNAKMQPQLRLGLNTVFVDLGEPSDCIVIWPDLQGDSYRQFIIEEHNIATEKEHAGWRGVMFAQKPDSEAFTVYRVQCPRPITGLVYGGRFYNRVAGGEIRLSHSFDGGKTWQTDWTLTDTSQPWDVIHYATVRDIAPDSHEVLLKYSLRAPQAGPMACSIYSVCMEVRHQATGPTFEPLDVTFTWDEVQSDRSRITRSHRQRIDHVPMRYTINVGGVDHPIVKSLRIECPINSKGTHHGYSDTRSGLGQRVTDVWQELGRNLLIGKSYKINVEPTGAWGADDPEGRKLTDGVVGPNYAGGTSMRYAVGFDEKNGPAEITVDMQQPQQIAGFGIHITAGWPWWDALKGEVRDEVEVWTSLDGQTFARQGTFNLNLWRREIPINHMLPDDETAQGWNYILPLSSPVTAQFVRFRITARRSLGVTEVQAFDRIDVRPFDLRILLPDESP
ncbi:discoidin domain-containing protein [Thermogutta sp.]|uniref:discoidin domain-containing protein n=1 Tax=Thermogutta sp. TaxID=1962930 RepID=UPI0032207F48